jgi:hypothetical protein
MAFAFQTPRIGMQPIATTSTVQNHPTGTIVHATDPTLGSGEFIYLLGVINTVVGSLVTYVASTGVTVLSTTSGVVNGGAPLAVAMSANVASQWGWYQIAGDATIKKTAVKVDPAGTTKVYLSATAGRVMQTSVAGRQVIGARWITATTVTSTTSTAIATLNRPVQQGAIT